MRTLLKETNTHRNLAPNPPASHSQGPEALLWHSSYFFLAFSISVFQDSCLSLPLKAQALSLPLVPVLSTRTLDMIILSHPPTPHAFSRSGQVPKIATPSFHWGSDQILLQDLYRSDSNVRISDFQTVSCESSRIVQIYTSVSFPEK